MPQVQLQTQQTLHTILWLQENKNSFEFMLDCELVLFLLLLLWILKTIGHDVDEDVKLNFPQQNFIVFVKCAFLVQFYQFLSHNT